ncbi:MAG: T9SS type A sorting domain-containing protein, partial [Bacteroidota bacterium]|nr:T9SS type A sorting domain-containing protein [Bacteroidota bacterium]
TGTSQTALTLSIRNNAPGGGGNDWALDDISLATCLPDMRYSPSLNPSVCASSTIDINDTVQSYFNNYTYYKWQRSTNGGSSWSDETGASGPASPTWTGSAWKYITTYTVPSANTTLANNGDLYRVVVATTSSNLSTSSCLFTDGISIINLNVSSCGPFAINLISFNGKVVNNMANLFWRTSREDEPVRFDIEKSTDGINYSVIGSVNGYRNYNDENNYYSFIDPTAIYGKMLYRLAINTADDKKKYSRVIKLNQDNVSDLALYNVLNPFNSELDFDIVVTENNKIDVFLMDMIGNTVKQESLFVYEGINSLSVPNTERLKTGMYILQISNKQKTISKKVMKK